MFYNTRTLKNNEDLFNNERKRNVNNTNKNIYNCGGYALETFSWYVPRDSHGRVNNAMHDDSIQTMLKDFPTLRIINTIDDLQPNEYAIAYKTSENDFHFIKRSNNGHWFHKMGDCDIIETMPVNTVFNEKWNGRYDSELTLFAKKRE